MLNRYFTNNTTAAIYLGTLLLSILSFITTFRGLSIVLSTPLALLGSFGLQAAMLGIAWNLMRVKVNRLKYVMVFLVAAAFSIFFSFASFDSNLKSDVRAATARSDYSEAIRPMLTDYSSAAKKASVAGRYQVERIGKLLELERDHGWAIVADEGSGDSVVQSIIDGARRAAVSWEETQGKKYRHGRGEGIIANYLETRLAQTEDLVGRIDGYVREVDSLMLLLSSDVPVEKQYALANRAWVSFPANEIAMVANDKPLLRQPPSIAGFIETPENRKQAFKLVLTDFIEMDGLALFSLLLAIAIDFIVIILAFAGSYVVEDVDFFFDKVKQDTARRIMKLKLDDPEQLNEVLEQTIKRFQTAGKYGLDQLKVMTDYDSKKKEFIRDLEHHEELVQKGDLADLFPGTGEKVRNRLEQDGMPNSASDILGRLKKQSKKEKEEKATSVED